MQDMMEMWAGGNFRSSNIGPAAGDHLLGRFEGPGVYLLVGDNASGKTIHLDLLSRAQKDRLLRADANITDGQLVASFELGALKIAFRKNPLGEVGDPERSGAGDIPPVESMSHTIQTLIDADHLKGDPERARRRLEALLTYCPVPGTEELVRALCGTLEERSFTEPGPIGFEALWWSLSEEAKGSRRIKIVPFRTAAKITSWLLSQEREGVLEDHRRLMDALNDLGLTAEHAAAVQARHVSATEGELAGAARAAWVTKGGTGDPSEAFMSEIRSNPDMTSLEKAERKQAERAVEVRAGRAARLFAEEDRAHLRETHGPSRPDADETRYENLRISAAATRAKEGRSTQELDEANSCLRSLGAPVETAIKLVDRAWEEVAKDFQTLSSRFGIEGIPDGDTLRAATRSMRERLSQLEECVKDAAEITTSLEIARLDLDAKRDAHVRAEEAAGLSESARLEALGDLEATKERQHRWEEVDQLLQGGVDGPTQEQLDATLEDERQAKRDLEVGRAAIGYLKIFSRLEAARGLLALIEERGRDFRLAAKDSWVHLGKALTSELAVPWLTVHEQELVIHYDGETGLLRQDESRPADARSIDDSERISVGELHDAMLTLMLEKRDDSGGFIIVPWQVVAALDEDHLARFNRMVADHGLYVLSERPRRRGDPAEMFLERVADRGEEVDGVEQENDG